MLNRLFSNNLLGNCRKITPLLNRNIKIGSPGNINFQAQLNHDNRILGHLPYAEIPKEKLVLIEPNINEITLAKIETKFGKFDLAINKLTTLYNNPNKTNNQKYNILRALSEMYYIIGQVKKAIETSERAYKLEPT